MRRRLLSSLGALVVGLVVAGCGAEQPVVEGLMLPAGDPAAGRQAFVDLRCHTCHAVPGDAEMPAPVSANRGPAVGSMGADETREHLALSIISPSHEIPPPRDSSLSHMGSFREALNVQQLLDLVTYLDEANR